MWDVTNVCINVNGRYCLQLISYLTCPLTAECEQKCDNCAFFWEGMDLPLSFYFIDMLLCIGGSEGVKG